MGRSKYRSRIPGLAVLFTLALTTSCYSDNAGAGNPPPAPPYDVAVYEGDLAYAQVVHVRATLGGANTWRFDVAVRHNDQGWDHYADLWEVVRPDTGGIIAQRVLAHPHDTEQPFTRSQSGIELPEGVTTVLVRAKCTVHGYGGKSVLVDTTTSSGEGFEILLP